MHGVAAIIDQRAQCGLHFGHRTRHDQRAAEPVNKSQFDARGLGGDIADDDGGFGRTDGDDPDRGAVSEYEALHEIFKVVRKGIKASGCNRAIMVAHNANFDHSFMMAAAERASLKRNPFHPFATFDTAALAGLALGQTVLSKACQTAGMDFDSTQAHSALYDTERTAVLFCEIVNRWKRLGGWPLPAAEEV